MFKIFLLFGIVSACTCSALTAGVVVAPTLPLLDVPITAVSSQFIQRNYHTTLPVTPLTVAPVAALAPAAPLIAAAPWSARLVGPVTPAFADYAFGTVGSAALIAPARVVTPLRRFIRRYAAPATLLTLRRYPVARQRVYRYSSYY